MAHSLSFMKHYFMFSMNDDIVWRTKSAHFMHVGSLKVSTDDIEESCFVKLFDAVSILYIETSVVFILAVGTWPTRPQISDEDHIVLEKFQHEFLQCVVNATNPLPFFSIAIFHTTKKGWNAIPRL